jgi:3-oxoacyl-[acyl-carrier protein] reductase
MTTQGQLSGKVAVVTGGSRGIGKAISLALAAKGAFFAVNYARGREGAEQTVKEICDAGGAAKSYGFDIADSEAVNAAFKDIIAEHGNISVLVNNAGIAIDGLLMRTKDEEWARTLDVNLSGAFYCCRAVAKSMLKAKGGRIINVSSVIGQMGNAGQSAYSATKAALFGFSKSLAKELGSRSVTVNAVAPGYIETDMTAMMTEEQRSAMLDAIPLKRLGSVQDVAGLVSFLASDEAGYITGEVIAVNGGLRM